MARTASTRAARGGIDLGGTKIETVIVDSRSKVLGSARRPTPEDGGTAAVAAEMATALADAADAAGVKPADLLGVGVGSPGVVDPDGTVSTARNLSAWEGSFALGPALAKELGTAVFVGNDVQVATDAEFSLGAGKPYKSLLGVFWGTGVGGGMILGGKPWIGRGGGGEIGHMVVNIGGRKCGCGRLGCMEAYAGRASMEARARKREEKGQKTELFKIMKERERTRLTSSIWAHALDKGDKLATELIDDAVEALGAGVGSAVNLLDVDAVILGGGLGVRFGQPFADRLSQAMHPHLFNDQNQPDVLVAALGDLGGAIGAALLARQARRRAPAPA